MRRRVMLRAVQAAALAAAVATAGCGGAGAGGSNTDGPAVERGAPPAFAEAAERYNQSLGGAELKRLRSGAVVRMSFIEDGKRRTEQGEGLLQAISPDRFALSIRKVGTPLIWIGCDQSRSWWFDLTDEPVTAIVGDHSSFSRDMRERAGLAVGPRELALLIGLSGLELGPGIAGGTQWSRDGRLLGITVQSRGATRRVWVDPETYRARLVEWFEGPGGRSAQATLVAELEGEERVEAPELSGPRPVIPARVSVHHLPTGTFIQLDLSGAETGRVSDDAFEFDALVAYHRAERVLDLDTDRP